MSVYRIEEVNAVNEDLFATVTEANHILNDTSFFQTNEIVDDETEVKMGNNIRTALNVIKMDWSLYVYKKEACESFQMGVWKMSLVVCCHK